MKIATTSVALVLSALIAVIPTSATAAKYSTTSRHDYIVADGVTLQLDVPDGWRGGLGAATGPMGMAIVEFGSSIAPRFQITLSPVALLDPKDLEESVRAIATEIGKQSTESSPPIQSLAADHGSGWYFRATDKQYVDPTIVPGPGEYKYVIQGALPLGQHALIFTILTNDDSRDVEAPALAMVKKAAIQVGAAST